MTQFVVAGGPLTRPRAVAFARIGGWAALALALGLLIARLPVTYSLAILGGGTLFIAALFEPLVGLFIMVAVGLSEPLLAAAGLLPVPYSQVIFLLFAGAWLAKGISRHEIRWPSLPITIFFFVYLVACALSVYFHQPISPKDAATELWKWAQMYTIAGIVYDTAGRRKLNWVLLILLTVGVIEAGIGIWQFQFRGHGPDGFQILGDHWRAYGTLEQPNPFAGFMGVVWPIAAMLALNAAIAFIQYLWRHYHPPIQIGTRPAPQLLRPVLLIGSLGLVTVATLAALFLSFSRGAWLGAAAAGVVMLAFWPRRRWIGITLALGGLIAFLFLYQFNLLPASISNRFADVGDFLQVYDVRGVHINDTNFAIVERLAHWQAAVNMANAQPLFGVGFGNYEPDYANYRLVAWQYGLGHAHNIYLNVLAETGVVGLLAYLFFWGGIVVLTIRAISRNAPLSLNRAIALGLLGCWVHLATHQILDNLYVGNIPLYLGILFGLLCLVAQLPANSLESTLPSHATHS